MLSAEEIALVKNSWSLIIPVSQKMGEEFYEHLFEQHPELRALFKRHPKDQAMKFMFMLSYLVVRLDRESELRDEIKKLAIRHAGYKAQPEHYPIIGDTLMWSLEKNLGKDWTRLTAVAWQKAYAFISGMMIEAMNGK